MKSFGKIYKILLYLIGVPVFLYLLYDYGFDKILNNLEEVSWWFGAVLLTWLVIYLLNTFSWHTIIRSGNASIPGIKLFSITVAGYAINYITPFVSLGGEPYKVMALNKHMEPKKSAANVLLYTMMHMFSHIWFWIFGLIIMIWNISFSSTYVWLISGSVVLIAFLFFVFNNMFRNGFVFRAYKFFTKVPLLNIIVLRYSEKEDYIKDIDSKLSAFYNNDKPRFYLSLTAEFLSRIVGAFEYYFILMAVGVNISFLDAVYISAASSLIANIIFFMPMQLVTREGSLYFVFKTLSIDPNLCVITSLITRIREFAWIGLGFLLMAIFDTKANGGKTGLEQVGVNNAN